MANTFLTTQEIARETLVRLRANEVMSQFVNRDFQNEFSDKGDTIRARVPATATASEFSGTVTAQDITEEDVTISLDKIADVTFAITSKQKTLNISDFGFQVIDPAVTAIAEKIDQDLNGLYIDVPYFSGTAGTTPETLASLTGVRKVLADNKVPNSQRRLVIDTTAAAGLLGLDSLVEIDKSGMSATLREAILGRIYGFELAESQHVKTHTAGGFTALTDVTTTGAADATSLVLTSGAGASTATLLKGDLMTIDGNQHVVTADTAAAVAGVVTASIYPAVPAGGYAASTAVTFVASHTANLAFHRNAITLAVRPMALPSGADGYTTSFDGLSIRVVQDYTATGSSAKQETISFDILYGMKVTQKELAARLLG